MSEGGGDAFRTPAERRALDKLRRFARLFATIDATGHESTTSPTPLAFASRPSRRAGNVLMALAAAEVALVLLLLLPWHWDDYHRAHGDVAVYMTVVLAGDVASAGLLLFPGRRDRRTWLLGGYFLFKATLAPAHMLPAFMGQMPPAAVFEASLADMSAQTRILLHLLYAYPLGFAVAPALLWAFARECPRVHRRTRFDDFARRMVTASVAIGGAMCVCVVSAYWAGVVGDLVDEAIFFRVLEATIVTPNVLSLAAMVVVALRAHTAPAEEKRRVVVFSAGFLMWMGVATAYDLVECFTPGFWLSNYESGSVLLLVQPLRFPGVLLLWYSVLAVRVPHPREVIRAGYGRLLMSPGRLGASAAAPAAALGWLLARRPDQQVGAVMADPLAQGLFAATGLVLLVLVARERLLVRLDAWICPETEDQRQMMAAATAALAKAERMSAINRTLTRVIKRGCGSPCLLLVADNARADAHDFRAPVTTIVPLPRTSAIVHMLETGGGALRVHPSDAKSVFELLPPDEAAWVVETAADVIVPVPGPGTRVVGIVVVERRFDDRIVRDADVPFLEVLAAAAGQAITRLQLLYGTEMRLPEATPALECSVCGCVTGGDEPPGCDCESAYVETEVPRLLASKYRLTRRLGAGAMSSVYLAWDLSLQRDVTVKSLTKVSVSRSLALKPEAWAMARVAHPGLAEIYGVETWRGRPFLVVEFLRGGTLADRLRNGPVPEPEAVAVAVRLAEALAALHGAGYLHGDVKPSNIGFTADGLPKLLDFGLARGPNDLKVAGGTLLYLSPEVLNGRPANEADDVWSLCVVLYEMVSGEHPFMGDNIDEVVDRIRNQRVSPGARPASGSETSSPVAALAASMLTASRAARPTTARAYADVLRGVLTRSAFSPHGR